jgi:hypothetical protein
MKDARDQDDIHGLAVEDGMAGGFYLLAAGAEMARVASEVRKVRHPSERFLQPRDVFSARARPIVAERLGQNVLNAGVSFTR